METKSDHELADSRAPSRQVRSAAGFVDTESIKTSNYAFNHGRLLLRPSPSGASSQRCYANMHGLLEQLERRT